MKFRSTIPAAALALVVAMSACSDSTSSTATAERPLPTIGLGSDLGFEFDFDEVAPVEAVDTVVMIGDSITVGSEPALRAAFDQLGFTEIVIDAQNSKRTTVNSTGNPSGLRIAEGIVALDPESDRSDELWVVALGTNDINQYGDAADIEAVVDEILTVVPAESPLVWVDTYYRSSTDGAEAVNAVIRDRVSARGNAVVARWSDVAGADGVLRSDGLHPNDDGTSVFAAVVADAIAVLLDLR